MGSMLSRYKGRLSGKVRFAGWLKMLLPDHLARRASRRNTSRNSVKTMSASEWRSSKQLSEQAAQRIASSSERETERHYSLPQYAQQQPGDIFPPSLAERENYRSRNPQKIVSPARLDTTSLPPREAPARFLREQEKDRSHLFGITQEDMQWDATGDGNAETERMPALYQWRVFLRTREE